MNINQFKIEFKKKIGTIKIFNKYIFMSKLLNLHKTKIKSMMNIIMKKDIFNRGLINYNKFIDLLCDNGIIFNSLDENFQEILEFLSEYDVDEGQHQQFGIEPQGAMLQIIQVEFQTAQHLLHRIGVAII